MSDPSVGIKLNFDTKSLKPVIASIKSQLQSVGRSLNLQGLTNGLSPAISAIKSQLQGLGKSFTIGTAIDKMIFRLRDAARVIGFLFKQGAMGPGTTSGIGMFIDAIDRRLIKSLKSVIPLLQRFGLHIKIAGLSGMISVLRAGAAAFDYLDRSIGNAVRAAVTFRKVMRMLPNAWQSIRNIQINPAAIFGGLRSGLGTGAAGIGAAVSGLSRSLAGVARIGAGVAIPALRGISSALIHLPGAFMRAGRSIFDFTFSLKGMVLAAATSGLGMLVVKAAQIADSFERSQWKFDNIFNGITESANKVASEIASTFKVNVASIQSQMSRSADVIKPLGMDQKTVLEITRNFAMLSQAATDWSEGRYDAERASTALMKALTGEKEMLKEFGVVITDQEIWNDIRSQGKEVNRLNFALAIYNKIMERTPDMQRAAFSRIGELSQRMSQFKESLSAVGAGLGAFIRPAMNELFGLFGTIGRKIAELLKSNTPELERWRALFKDIADSLKNMSSWVEGISMKSLGEDLKVIKKALGEVAKGFVNMLGKAFVGLAEFIGTRIGNAIAEAVKFGLERAKDVTGVNANKARMIMRHQSLRSAGMSIPMSEALAMATINGGGLLEASRYQIRGPSKEQVDWATKFEGRQDASAGFTKAQAAVNEFVMSLKDASGEVTDFGHNLGYDVYPEDWKPNWKPEGSPFDWDLKNMNFNKRTPGTGYLWTGGFGDPLGLTGPTSDPFQDPKYKSRMRNLQIQQRTMQLNMKKNWEELEKMTGMRVSKGKRESLIAGDITPESIFGSMMKEGTGRKGSLGGLQDAYMKLLERGAGKPDAGEKIVNKLQEINIQAQKQAEFAQKQKEATETINQKLEEGLRVDVDKQLLTYAP